MQKKNPKCKLFPKGGGGRPQSLHLKKVYTQWKEASKWISLTQECVLVSSESNRRIFGTPKFLFEIFLKKFTFRGGGGQRQFGKSLHFGFFFAPFPKSHVKCTYKSISPVTTLPIDMSNSEILVLYILMYFPLHNPTHQQFTLQDPSFIKFQLELDCIYLWGYRDE